eukprot:scaffold2612_cov267-Chaetoceros_neogracile.AAC.13
MASKEFATSSLSSRTRSTVFQNSVRSSLSSFMYLNNDLHPPCMTIRTLQDSLDEKTCERSKKLARIRLLRRTGMVLVYGKKKKNDDDDNSDGEDDSNQRPKDQTNSQTTRTSVVSFDRVNVRSYPIVLGDNPSVSKGAPISIDWQHFRQDNSDIDKYEEARQDARRSKTQMRIPYGVRYDILENAGEHDKTVDDVVNIEVKKEMARRWLKNVLKRSEKKKEKEIIKKSVEFSIAQGRNENDIQVIGKGIDTSADTCYMCRLPVYYCCV